MRASVSPRRRGPERGSGPERGAADLTDVLSGGLRNDVGRSGRSVSRAEVSFAPTSAAAPAPSATLGAPSSAAASPAASPAPPSPLAGSARAPGPQEDGAREQAASGSPRDGGARTARGERNVAVADVSSSALLRLEDLCRQYKKTAVPNRWWSAPAATAAAGAAAESPPSPKAAPRAHGGTFCVAARLGGRVVNLLAPLRRADTLVGVRELAADLLRDEAEVRGVGVPEVARIRLQATARRSSLQRFEALAAAGQVTAGAQLWVDLRGDPTCRTPPPIPPAVAAAARPVRRLRQPEAPPPLRAGSRVRRGPTWKWKDQDASGEGVVLSVDETMGWVQVRWESGGRRTYRYGGAGGHRDVEEAVGGGAAASPATPPQRPKALASEQLRAVLARPGHCPELAALSSPRPDLGSLCRRYLRPQLSPRTCPRRPASTVAARRQLRSPAPPPPSQPASRGVGVAPAAGRSSPRPPTPPQLRPQDPPQQRAALWSPVAPQPSRVSPHPPQNWAEQAPPAGTVPLRMAPPPPAATAPLRMAPPPPARECPPVGDVRTSPAGRALPQPAEDPTDPWQQPTHRYTPPRLRVPPPPRGDGGAAVELWSRGPRRDRLRQSPPEPRSTDSRAVELWSAPRTELWSAPCRADPGSAVGLRRAESHSVASPCSARPHSAGPAHSPASVWRQARPAGSPCSAHAAGPCRAASLSSAGSPAPPAGSRTRSRSAGPRRDEPRRSGSRSLSARPAAREASPPSDRPHARHAAFDEAVPEKQSEAPVSPRRDADPSPCSAHGADAGPASRASLSPRRATSPQRGSDHCSPRQQPPSRHRSPLPPPSRHRSPAPAPDGPESRPACAAWAARWQHMSAGPPPPSVSGRK
eukprot:TRINITY_DN10388_c0_g1_i2.p1 TRINITY_DN10388_c0_g1~~TRINITY_DN10388_c0_g1_i2.p1  ORF type:complete len:869 (+),score=114.26 TRINITY_DN10388_c0_g1_i2:64-2670(+)